MPDDELRSHDEKIVNAAVADLLRHFDTVQIFVTRQEPGNAGTVGFSDGLGNWYARMGQVRQWVDNGGAMNLEGEEDA